MNPNPISDTVTFLLQPGWTTAIFWLLLLGSIAIAAYVLRRMPEQRSLTHLGNWGMRPLAVDSGRSALEVLQRAASPDRHQASAPPSHLPDLLPAVAPAEEVPPAFVKATPVPSSDRPLYSRWGFWAVIGGVAVAGAATAVLLGSRHGASAPPSGGLGTIDWR